MGMIDKIIHREKYTGTINRIIHREKYTGMIFNNINHKKSLAALAALSLKNNHVDNPLSPPAVVVTGDHQ